MNNGSESVGGHLWRGYAKDADQDQVRKQFAQRFGYEPAKVLDAKTIWLAGPIGAPRQDDAQGEQLRLL